MIQQTSVAFESSMLHMQIWSSHAEHVPMKLRRSGLHMQQ